MLVTEQKEKEGAISVLLQSKASSMRNPSFTVLWIESAYNYYYHFISVILHIFHLQKMGGLGEGVLLLFFGMARFFTGFTLTWVPRTIYQQKKQQWIGHLQQVRVDVGQYSTTRNLPQIWLVAGRTFTYLGTV